MSTNGERAKPAGPRVAFVVQRAGREINGGAEHLCLMLAERLSSQTASAPWQIDILTTRAKDYLTWRDHYAASEERINSHCRILRFGVEKERNIATFGPLCRDLERALLMGTATDAQEAEWIRAQGPLVPQLAEYVARNSGAYDAFFFFCYQYGTTSLVMPSVADKAIVVPCAHDEWSLHLAAFAKLLAAPRGHIYLSPEEGEVVQRALSNRGLTPPSAQVAAVGFDGSALGNAERFRAKTGISGRFALYLGRLDEGKNTPKLFEYWAELYATSQQKHKLPQLVLIGGTATPVLFHESVRYLGFVDEETRNDALAACDFLINPSRYESLSLVLLEAWAASKPVLVNADCAVMKGQVGRARGGLSFSDYQSFAAGVYAMNENAARAEWGQAGRHYVARDYRWAAVLAAYQRALDTAITRG
jgi:glycosyltransferase involved in cell wall biosynthesis